MPAQTAAQEIRALKEAYALFSPLTNLPYVECEEENYNDQAFLCQTKKDAETAVADYEKKGIRVIIKELKTVEIRVPTNEENSQTGQKQLYLNQVRQHLGILPFIGVNAVCYKPTREKARSAELSETLPEGFEQKIRENAHYQPTLQLTGLYLMQEARRKKEFVDRKRLQDLDEEFSSNLAKSHLYLAALPGKGQEDEASVNLKECRLPYLKHQNGDHYFPVFTDIWEFQKYAQGKQGLRPIRIPFQELAGFWVDEAKAYMVNPMGFSLPLGKELIPRLLERFGTA